MSKKKSSLKNYFIELLVVVIGISIAFAIDKYAEGLKEDKEMTIALRSVADDLERDIKAFEGSQIPNNQNRVDELDFILEKLRNEELKNDSLHLLLRRMLGSANSRLTIATYETLKSSGKLDNIPNTKLKKLIVSHYEGNYNQSDYLSKSNIAYSEKLRDYISLNSSALFNNDFSERKLVTDPSFRNMISVWRGMIRFKVAEYKRMAESSRVVLDAINLELQ